MAFYPDVAIVVMIPVAGYPVGVGAGWGFIDAGYPDVSVAVPAMVAVVPGPVGVLVWRRGNALVDRGRRTNANYDLRLGNTCGREQRGDSERDFLDRGHVVLLLSALVVSELVNRCVR